MFPWAQVEDPVLAAADAAGVTGRVGTLAIICRDGRERPARLRFRVGRLEEQMARLPPDLDEGWRIAALSLSRSGIVRLKDGWASRSAWSVRMFRVD